MQTLSSIKFWGREYLNGFTELYVNESMYLNIFFLQNKFLRPEWRHDQLAFIRWKFTRSKLYTKNKLEI